MASVAMFNPLDVTRRLKQAAFTAQQAEGIADALSKDALTELATKADLAEFAMKRDVKDLELTLTIRLGAIMAAAVAVLAALQKLH